MKRELWLDYLRAYACILVTLGHLTNSFIESGLISKNGILSIGVQVIYHFHVYIFFFCSGYLFEKRYHSHTPRVLLKKKAIRCFDLVIPYFVFSFITYFIKTLLSDDVNTPVQHSFIQILCDKPIHQMWYLYALITILIATPIIRSDKSMTTILTTTLFLKGISLIPSIQLPSIIKYLMMNQIWFVMGMIIAYKKISINKKTTFISAIVFLFLSVAENISNFNIPLKDTILTISGILSSAGIAYLLSKDKPEAPFAVKLISKYMFQIYLLHTICAAGIRIILFKLQINTLFIHTIAGLTFSFIIPILCAQIAERILWINIVFFPYSTLKKLSAQHANSNAQQHST